MAEPDHPQLKLELLFKILLNVSGPLGVAATLLGWVKPIAGAIWIALSFVYVIWELAAYVRTFVRRHTMWSLLLFISAGALVGAGLWMAVWKTKPPVDAQNTATKQSHDQTAPETQPSDLPQIPGPGAALGMTGSVSAVVTPSTPKGGAMTGSFTTSGRGEYEVDILGVPPEELLFKPPNVVAERNKLPVDLLIDGHKMTIRKFTDKGFVIFDNGWRDISITVSLIRASSVNEKPALNKSESAPRNSPTPTSHDKLLPPTQIDQHGSGAVGGGISQGPCSNLQIGGSNNQATANCGPIEERHLSEEQKVALRSLVIPNSIRVTLTMTSEGDSQSYGGEIGYALNLAPKNQETGLVWSSPGPPKGVTVRIHDANEPQILQQFGVRLGQILGARGYLDNHVPAGEVRIVVGHAVKE